MFPWYLDIVFAGAGMTGLLLLIRKHLQHGGIVHNPNSVDFRRGSRSLFRIKEAG
jgi:hypothetical protein